MSRYRIAFLVLAALFTMGITSSASACCSWGCGACGTPTAAAVYAQPVAPAPPPVAVTTWGWASTCGCPCGCRGLFSYAAPGVEVTPVAPAPIYVVNQGPDYSGPGVYVPYRFWHQGYIGPGSYPYVRGYGYGAHRFYGWPSHHIAYRGHFYGHAHYWAPGARWHGYPQYMHH